MLKGIKFRLYPNQEQKELLEKQFGCSRFVYNWALDYSRWQYTQNNKTKTNRYDWSALLPTIKAYLPWIKDANSQSLQQELMHLQDAFTRFFKKLGEYPNFKSKYDKQSFTVPQHFVIGSGLLTIPKIKGIPVIITKDIKNHRSLTISKTKTGKYFVSVLYETGIDIPVKPIPEKNKAIGIDLGLKHFAIISTGEKKDNPKFYQKAQKQLRRLQKSLSRKKKDSSNRAKAKQRVALRHERTANQRSDFLHQFTYELTCKNQGVNTICVENLNVKGMIQNHNLSKSIADVGWGEFFRQLQYKCGWYTMNLLECGRFDATSQICSNCGWKNTNLKLSDRFWECDVCNCKHDRDINAAKNIVDFAFKKLYREDTRDFKPLDTEALARVNIIASEPTVEKPRNRKELGSFKPLGA